MASASLLVADAAYTADTLADATLLAGDGLDVRYAPNVGYLTGAAAEYTDIFHVTPLGAEALAESFLAVLR